MSINRIEPVGTRSVNGALIDRRERRTEDIDIFHKAGCKTGTPRGRAGYTLLEILVATTLALLLMYGVATIFSQVGTLMSETQNVMGMSNSLRSAKDRLQMDLKNVTVPRLTPPTSRYGFFSYVEGLGADYGRVNELLDATANSITYGDYFPVDTALNGDLSGAQLDKTVGDTDDILSFTARAPEGEWFRGRMLARDYDFSEFTNEADRTAFPPTEIVESEYAEIIWFVRGTTLYRRVLPIVPDNELQRRLAEADAYCDYHSLPRISSGYGFYRLFDVSVHLENGRVTANRVADLANRRNRFGCWNSPTDDTNQPIDLGQHGVNGAWYWLRMPTMQECFVAPSLSSDTSVRSDRTRYFRAGSPFGVDDAAGVATQDAFRWFGTYQIIYADNLASTELPDGGPFIDFWNNPNVWSRPRSTNYNDGVDPETGDLWFSLYPEQTDVNIPLSRADFSNADVVLTNVISFDVKVWDKDRVEIDNDGAIIPSPKYVNLGEGKPINIGTDPDSSSELGNENSFFYTNALDQLNSSRSFCCPGWYKRFVGNVNGYSPNTSNPANTIGEVLNYPFMPAVFDTWTEEYELEHLLKTFAGNVTAVSRRPNFAATDVPLDGTVTADHLPDYPPPYRTELRGLKVEMRVFDPVSRSIRNVSLEIDMSNR